MNFKKLTGDLSTSFNRAVQYTEEKLGQAERTQLDSDLERLLLTADSTQRCAEQLVKYTEAVLQPNPAHRVEDNMYDRLERDRRERTTPLEDLGNAMTQASAELPGGGEFALALSCAGQAELKLARAEREFVRTSGGVLIRPLRQFLDEEVKAVQRERRTLESLRLDLDSAKARLRRSREGTKTTAEQECDRAQHEFNRQAEVLRQLLEGVEAAQSHHSRCLSDFLEAQMQFHAECFHKMQELRQQMSSS